MLHDIPVTEKVIVNFTRGLRLHQTALEKGSIMNTALDHAVERNMLLSRVLSLYLLFQAIRRE